MVFRSKRSTARATSHGASGTTADPAEMDAPDARATTTHAEPSHVTKAGKTAPRTRISSAWTIVGVGLLFLIALLIFIFQNLETVRVTFITFHGSFPLALSLLCASVAGALVVLLLGVARIIQLRRVARHHRDAAAAARTS